MSQIPFPEPSPSWLPSIAAGALVAMLAQSFAMVLPTILPQAMPIACCCCFPGAAAPSGAIAAMMAFRRDPRLSPGQGFTIAFIATGLASAIVAMLMIVQMPDQSPEAAAAVREALLEFDRQYGNEPRPESEIDEMVELSLTMLRYAPPVAALVFTLLGALSGLIAVLVLRGRAPPAMPAGSDPP